MSLNNELDKTLIAILSKTIDEIKERYFICLEYIESKGLQEDFRQYIQKYHKEKIK